MTIHPNTRKYVGVYTLVIEEVSVDYPENRFDHIFEVEVEVEDYCLQAKLLIRDEQKSNQIEYMAGDLYEVNLSRIENSRFYVDEEFQFGC